MSWFTKVANKAKDALSQAVILASTPIYDSDVEEFHSVWQRVLTKLSRYPIEVANGNTPLSFVHDTVLREWLHRLVTLLEAEDNAISDYAEIHLLSERKQQELGLQSPHQSSNRHRASHQQEQPTRDCLEYLLEKQIVTWLCDAGQKDSPPGMMAVSLEFAARLLAHVQYPLLPTTEIRVAILKLITCAARKEIEDLQVREQLLHVLHTLWCKLRGDHVQIEVFFHRAERLTSSGGVAGAAAASAHPPLQGFDGWDASNQEISELVLFTALLPHMFANGPAGHNCREALCIAASSRDTALIRFVLTLTPFCHYVVNGIIMAFEALPKHLSRHREDHASMPLPLPMQLAELATRIRFCCTLAMVGTFELLEPKDKEWSKTSRSSSGNSITLQLLHHFVTRFLCGNLLEGLLHTSESIVLTNLHYARLILEELLTCGQDLQANPLLMVYLEFLLVNYTPFSKASARFGGILSDLIALEKQSTSLGKQPQTSPSKNIETQLSRLAGQLVHHMNSMSSALSVEAMDLFETILSVKDGWLDQVLTTCNVGNAAPSSSSSSSPGKATCSEDPHTTTQNTTEAKSGQENAPKHTHFETVSWLAARFPGSQVATYGDLWKKSDFGTMPMPRDTRFEETTPVSPTGVEMDPMDPVVSVLGYIADVEYAMCRIPTFQDEEDEGEDDDDDEEDQFQEESVEQPISPTSSASSGVEPRRPRRLSRTFYSEDPVRLYFTPLKRLDLTVHIPAFTPVSLKRIQLEAKAQAKSGASGSKCASPRAESPRNRQSSTNSSPDSDGETSCLPFFHRIVLNRVERILENSLVENLAISGIVSALAKRSAWHDFVYDSENVLGRASVRAILEEVYTDGQRRIARLPNGASTLQSIRMQLMKRRDWNEFDHLSNLETGFPLDPTSSGGTMAAVAAAGATGINSGGDARLFLGMAFLDEFLKELCSILFCKQKVMMLPVKPEGFYMQPKLAESHMTHVLSSTSLSSELAQLAVTSPTRFVVQEKKEMEGMFATAKQSLDNILHKA